MNPEKQKFDTLLKQYNFNIDQHKKELEVKKQECELQIALHQSLLDNSEKTIKQLQNNIISLAQMNKDLIQKLDLKENEIRDSQKKSIEQQSQSNEGYDQQRRIQALEKDLQAANLKIQESAQLAVSTNQNLADKLQECLRFKAEKGQLNKTIEELQKQLSDVHQLNMALNRKLEEQSNEYQTRLNKIQNAYEKQQEEISNLKSEKEEMKIKNDQLQKINDKILKDKQELIRKNEADMAQLNKLINQEPKGTLYPEIINHQKKQISDLNEKLNQSSGVYNLYVPQQSKIQEFENKDVALQFKQKFIEDSNGFTSYPIEDQSGNVVGISLISKPYSQQLNRPLKKINNFMS